MQAINGGSHAHGFVVLVIDCRQGDQIAIIFFEKITFSLRSVLCSITAWAARKIFLVDR